MPTARATPSSERPPEPWVETRSGGLFFLNALLVFPHVMVLVPLLTRVLVRARGGMAEEAPIIDTFPMIAEYLLPRAGWLLVVPIALVVLNLRRMPDAGAPRGARAALVAFLLLHATSLAWMAATWLGWTGGRLPGAP